MDTKESKKTLWIIAGVIVGAIAIFGVLIAIILGAMGNEPIPSESDSTQPVASKEEISNNLVDLDKDIRQSVADQKAAEAALNDDSKRIDLGN